jgi:endonuclease YncB( thermonuclease family)
VPEVIDTATLSVGGKVVPLFGVQWSRGAGEPSDLAGYLRNREVTCRPAEGSAKAYRCEVDGQDLSKVVLFNGGGRATSEASPDLLAAEAHARSAKTGLWAKASP